VHVRNTKLFIAIRGTVSWIKLPITKAQFSGGSTFETIEQQVLKYLTSSPQAYTAMEITGAIFKLPKEFALPKISVEEALKNGPLVTMVSLTLEGLMKQNKVLGRIVDAPTGRDVYFIAA